jgi:hypothetical protein
MESAMTPQDLATRGYLDERTMEPSEEFVRSSPSFSRKISDKNAYYTDPETGFFYNEDASRVGQYFTGNQGNAATAEGASGFAEFNPNFEYRLVDKANKGNVVFSGTGREGLAGVQGAAQNFAQTQGDKGDWAVEQFDPSTGQWSTVARDTKPSNIVGKIADIALPVAGAILLPGVGGALGGALGAGLGAAGGSALSSAAQGRSLGDTLQRAALSGVAAGGLSAATGALGAGASSAGGGTSGLLATGGVLPTVGGGFSATLGGAGGALGSAAGSLGNEIVVSGARQAANSAISGLAGAAGAAGGAAAGALPSAPSQQPAPFRDPATGDLVLTGSATPAPAPNFVTGALPGLAAGAPALVYGGPEGQLSEIIAEQPRRIEPEPQEPAPQPIVPPLSPEAPLPEIVVERDRLPTSFDTPVPPLVSGLPDLTQTPVDTPDLEPEKSLGDKLKDRLSNLDLVDYLRLAGLGIGALGSLGGGGGRQGAGTIPAGFGSGFAPVFGGGLPAPTLPGATGNFAPRTAADLRPQTTQDWYRYGYGPEQSFFDYVPQGEENKSQAYTGYAEGGDVIGPMGGLEMAGDSYAVNGPGTGRSDEIPALLSDGEYVMDAETVALLGDGSSKAGAERLDQFRINLRRDKGRKLARGEFSVDAKRPEQYLKGGRV